MDNGGQREKQCNDGVTFKRPSLEMGQQMPLVAKKKSSHPSEKKKKNYLEN